MKTKSYYAEDECFTKECLDLTNEICELVSPIFKREIAKGYGIREICSVIQNAVFDEHLSKLLDGEKDED